MQATARARSVAPSRSRHRTTSHNRCITSGTKGTSGYGLASLRHTATRLVQTRCHRLPPTAFALPTVRPLTPTPRRHRQAWTAQSKSLKGLLMVKLPKSSKHDVLSTTCSNKMMNFILQPFFSRRRVLRATPPLDLLLRYDSSTPTSSNANPPFPPCHQYTHAHAHARTFVHFPRTRTLSLSLTHTHSISLLSYIWSGRLNVASINHNRTSFTNCRSQYIQKNPFPSFAFFLLFFTQNVVTERQDRV